MSLGPVGHEELCSIKIVCVPGVILADSKSVYDLIAMRIVPKSGSLQDGTGHGTDRR